MRMRRKMGSSLRFGFDLLEEGLDLVDLDLGHSAAGLVLLCHVIQ